MIKKESLSYQAISALERPPRSNSKIGYKGVVKCGCRGKYYFYPIVFEGKPGKRKYLASCKTAEEAAKVYDAWILENVGDWAWTNFHKNERSIQISKT